MFNQPISPRQTMTNFPFPNPTFANMRSQSVGVSPRPISLVSLHSLIQRACGSGGRVTVKVHSSTACNQVALCRLAEMQPQKPTGTPE